MSKSFEIKSYDAFGTFKKQINPNSITSKIEFTEELNGGQGTLNLSLVGDLDDFVCSDIVEVREVDEENRSISPTYTGIIEEIGVTEYRDREVIDLQILGVFTVLNDIFYKNGGSRVFTKTDTPGNIVKDIIDQFNAEYGALSGDSQNLGTNLLTYTVSSIDVTGTTISREYDNINGLTALKQTLENTGFDFYIDSSGVVWVQKIASQTSKVMTFEREVLSIPRTITKSDMVNRYYLERTGNVNVTYNDTVARSIFNLKEERKVDTDIQDVTTQNTLGNQKLADYAYERNSIEINTLPQKSNSIIPGHLITVQNLRRQIVEKQITKIKKGESGWTLYVGDFLSFGKSVIEGK